MRAIILAAGVGRRLAGLGGCRPKCLLPCPQGTLLENALARLAAAGVTNVTVVVGFQRELVEEFVGRWPTVTTLINERFETTNTIHSLYLAREHLRDAALILNGDLWFRREALDAVLKGSGSRVAVVAGPCGAEEVKVLLDARGRVLRIGKFLSSRHCQGESVGMAYCGAAACEMLVDVLVRYNEALGWTGEFYETALDPVLDREIFRAAQVSAAHVTEIDTPEDLARAQQLWALC